MRITQLSTFNSTNRYLNDNREALAKYQQQLSSGKRVTKASDDSIAFTTSRLLSNSIRKNDQYQTNISNGLNKARSAQEAMDKMIDVLIDFKSIAVNAANDTLTDANRENMADQVAGLKEKIIDLGNTEFNGAHLFAGTNTAAAPFAIDTNGVGGVSDVSNDNEIKAKISDTSNVAVSVTGNKLRDTGSGDLFGMMQDVEDALRANDKTAVNAELDRVDDSIDHVVNLTSVLGNNINRLDSLSSQLEGQAINQEGEVSRLTDTDFADAISNVQKHETTYQAALAVHSRIIQTSLLDFL